MSAEEQRLEAYRRTLLDQQGCVLTQREVSLLLGVSQARVKQLEDKALRKMARHPLMRQLARAYDLIAEDE